MKRIENIVVRHIDRLFFLEIYQFPNFDSLGIA